MAKVPGPKPTDITYLTRNRLWAWIVLCSTPDVDSWGRLDQFWLGKIDKGTPTDGQSKDDRGRRRTFERYYHIGNDPKALKGLNTLVLVDVVHADPLQWEAEALYESALWELTGPAEPSLARVVEIHAELLKKLQLIRMTPTQRLVASETGLPKAMYDNSDLRNIEECAMNVAAIGTVDAIALLGCTFRMAMDALSLKEADIYLHAIRFAVKRFLLRWDAEIPVRDALVGLVELRLIQRRPGLPVRKEWLGFKVRTRGQGRDSEPESKSVDKPVLPTGDERRYRSPIMPLYSQPGGVDTDLSDTYCIVRERILSRLAVMDNARNSDGAADNHALWRQRAQLVDGILLEVLNSHDEAAFQAERRIHEFARSGGLWKILDDMLNPTGVQLPLSDKW